MVAVVAVTGDGMVDSSLLNRATILLPLAPAIMSEQIDSESVRPANEIRIEQLVVLSQIFTRNIESASEKAVVKLSFTMCQ